MILVNGALAAYLARGDRVLLTWLPDGEPQRSKTARAVARALLGKQVGDSVRVSVPKGVREFEILDIRFE